MDVPPFVGARRLWRRLLHEPLVVPRNPIGPFAVLSSVRPTARPPDTVAGLAGGAPCAADAQCASGVCRRHRHGSRCARHPRRDG
jgi:hypothetical protein